MDQRLTEENKRLHKDGCLVFHSVDYQHNVCTCGVCEVGDGEGNYKHFKKEDCPRCTTKKPFSSK